MFKAVQFRFALSGEVHQRFRLVFLRRIDVRKSLNQQREQRHLAITHVMLQRGGGYLFSCDPDGGGIRYGCHQSV